MEFIQLMLGLALASALIAIPYWIWRRQWVHKGLGFTFHWWLFGDFLAGIAISAVAMTGIFIVGWLLGAIVIDEVAFDWSSLRYWATNDLFGAAFEEIVSRSLQLNGIQIALGLITALVLTKSLGGTYTSRIDKMLVWYKWPAILLTSALFGYVHIRNPNATLYSAFGNSLGGLMYGIAFFGGRNIWLPIGMHFSWNYVQGSILGFLVSGTQRGGLVSQHSVADFDRLMGGGYGVEGGLVGMAFRFVVIALVLYYLYLRAGRRGNVVRLEFPIAVYDNPPGSVRWTFGRKQKAPATSA